MDLERVDRLAAEGDGLAQAQRQALAFHQPQDLMREFDRYRLRAGLFRPVRESMEASNRVVERMRKRGNRGR